MGLPVSRLTDQGLGDDNCHDSTKKNVTGIIIQGSGNVITNGLPTARLMDMVMRGDGHTGIIVGGAAKTLVNGLPVARIGDPFVGCFTGTLIEGSGNVLAG
jgi:uncharacterized Zn-binding protein involved in type VI secretion